MGVGDLQEDLCLVRPCLCLVPNSVVAILKLTLISELCGLTFMGESKTYVPQHVCVHGHAASSWLPTLHTLPLCKLLFCH